MPDQQVPPVSDDDVRPSIGAGQMECGVCWHVYDPAVGDDVWQISAGTAFAELPGHWRCPECDADKSKFLPVDGSSEAVSGDGGVEALIASYKRVDQERMQDLPFRNDRLHVVPVDFTEWQGGTLGVVITPWFMNLVLLAGPQTDWSAHKHGDLVTYALPSGKYDFVHGDQEGFGPIQSCSLLSPVTEFEDMAAAEATAREIMRLILKPLEGGAEPEGQALVSEPLASDTQTTSTIEPRGPISRREFLRGVRAEHS